MGKKYLILIADDKSENRLLLRKILASEDYAVQEAANGQEGLEIARLHKPDFIISDVLMPGMDGFQFCRKIKKDDELKKIPFVFYSATYVDRKDEAFALDLGAERYIVKPVEPLVFLNLIKDIIEKYRQGNFATPKKAIKGDEEVFKRYSERLVNKLEKKMLDLEKEIEARKLKEKALRESEANLREAQQIAKIGRWELDLKSNQLHWEPEIYEMFEIDPNKFGASYESFLDVIHPEDREKVDQAYTDSLESRKPYSLKHRLLMKDNRIKWVNEICRTEYDQEGKALRSIGIVQDITAEKEAEVTRKESEYKLLTHLQNTPIGAVSWNLEFKTVEWNPAAETIFGYTKEEAVGKHVTELILPQDLKELGGDIFQNLISEKESSRSINENITKDGRRIICDWYNTALKDFDGKVVGIASLVHDITERKQFEEALRESEDKYRSMMEAMDDAAYICSPDFRVEYMNPTMIKRTGREAIGEPCHKVIHGLDEKCPWCIIERVSKGEHVKNEVVNPETGKTYHVSNSPMFHRDGSFSKLGIYRDITGFKKLEEQFRQAQKMEAIGVLAGGVAHDFNNILTTIIGNASLALMETDKDDSLREAIEEIKTAGERAAALTRQLLAFSRKQIIQPKILDLNELLTDIEKMLGRLIGEDVELLTTLEPALWRVEIDPGQMEQVIMNLAINARDAMPLGGKVTIETANIDLYENYFSEHSVEAQPGSYVVISISDTGVGMDKKTQEHIFDPFFTTKGIGKGTGLGLSTVYGIVKQHNGFVWVYSEPGQGSTFKVYLPKVKGDAEVEEKKQSSESELGGSETVLIVEDEGVLRKLIHKVLRQYGYKVLEAENGEDAVKVSEANDGPIKLLITDVVMPKMGGKETAERLQPLYPQMKVIYMSGYTDDAIVQHGVLAPGLNFIEKPFTPEGLARKVREVLDSE